MAGYRCLTGGTGEGEAGGSGSIDKGRLVEGAGRNKRSITESFKENLTVVL